MRIRMIAGVIAALGMSLGFATVAHAENIIRLGTPINVSTQTEADDTAKAGDIIAVPVDVSTDTGSIRLFTINAEYDKTIFTAGVDVYSLYDVDYTAYEYLAGLGDADGCSEGQTYQLLRNMYTTGRGGAKTYYGSMTCNPNFVLDGKNNIVNATWNYSSSMALNSSEPEAYLLFQVNEGQSVTLDDLNFSIADAIDTQYNTISDLGLGIAGPDVDSTEAKVNACYGAFNINIDSSALPYWIQALYVSLDNGSTYVPVTEYTTTDNVNYTFPVRITTNSGSAESVDVTVYADTSTDQDGTTGAQTKVAMGTFNVALNSPTSYTNQTVSASAQ